MGLMIACALVYKLIVDRDEFWNEIPKGNVFAKARLDQATSGL